MARPLYGGKRIQEKMRRNVKRSNKRRRTRTSRRRQRLELRQASKELALDMRYTVQI